MAGIAHDCLIQVVYSGLFAEKNVLLMQFGAVSVKRV